MFYNKLSYHEALKAALKGDLVILLPKNANPSFLAFGAQKFNPLAIPLNNERLEHYHERSYLAMGIKYSYAKAAVLNVFENEQGVSHTSVQCWKVI